MPPRRAGGGLSGAASFQLPDCVTRGMETTRRSSVELELELRLAPHDRAVAQCTRVLRSRSDPRAERLLRGQQTLRNPLARLAAKGWLIHISPMSKSYAATRWRKTRHGSRQISRRRVVMTATGLGHSYRPGRERRTLGACAFLRHRDSSRRSNRRVPSGPHVIGASCAARLRVAPRARA